MFHEFKLFRKKFDQKLKDFSYGKIMRCYSDNSCGFKFKLSIIFKSNRTPTCYLNVKCRGDNLPSVFYFKFRVELRNKIYQLFYYAFFHNAPFQFFPHKNETNFRKTEKMSKICDKNPKILRKKYRKIRKKFRNF